MSSATNSDKSVLSSIGDGSDADLSDYENEELLFDTDVTDAEDDESNTTNNKLLQHPCGSFLRSQKEYIDNQLPPSGSLEHPRGMDDELPLFYIERGEENSGDHYRMRVHFELTELGEVEISHIYRKECDCPAHAVVFHEILEAAIAAGSIDIDQIPFPKKITFVNVENDPTYRAILGSAGIDAEQQKHGVKEWDAGGEYKSNASDNSGERKGFDLLMGTKGDKSLGSVITSYLGMFSDLEDFAIEVQKIDVIKRPDRRYNISFHLQKRPPQSPY